MSLVIHIGSQKTGTTAIQGFLTRNTRALRRAGVHYLKAGRTNIAHNSMLPLFRSGETADLERAIADECAAAPEATHVLSSEMFFRPLPARALAMILPEDLRENAKVVCYVRRQDRYLEALYKQFVKNGRIPADRMAFYERKAGELSYLPILQAWETAFGEGNVLLRPFERRHFPGGDVVEDFAALLGVDPAGFETADAAANKSLSAEVSEMLGSVSRHTGYNTRQIIRSLIASAPPGAIRSGDVFPKALRRQLAERYAEENEALRARYRPDLDALFSMDDLDEAAPDPCPGPEEQAANARLAFDAVMQVIGQMQKETA